MLTHRRASVADVPVLAVMNHQLIQDEGHRNRMTVPELEQRMKEWLEEEYSAIVFEKSNTIVAYALFRPDGDSVYVRQFFVKREHRRRGVGREAMRILVNDVLRDSQRLTLDVLVGNRVAREFWQATGFREYAVTMELI